MAIMYPKSLSAYTPTTSERLLYDELKKQLPDNYEVFYSYSWSYLKNDGKMKKSEADFIVLNPDYGFLCLEVKGGFELTIENGVWHIDDAKGGRDLDRSPYEQAEDSMYFIKELFKNTMHIDYPGVAAAGVVFPYYNIPDSELISNRNSECTIDINDMNNLEKKILKMFHAWDRDSYTTKANPKTFNAALVEMIKKKIAVAAAAGALIDIKEKQLDAINRVQNGYVTFLDNIRQFYVRGGAGTGKTWIAIKFANQEASNGNKVLLTAKSPKLIELLRKEADPNVDVKSIKDVFEEIKVDGFNLDDNYTGIENHIKESFNKYDALFVDEAQDLSSEVAFALKHLLRNENKSRLGVFYDDVQILRDESFGDAFMISTPPFILKENIRNTSSIYSFATERTNLGLDEITNPIEGPIPTVEKFKNYSQLTNRLGNLLKEYLITEKVKPASFSVLVDDYDEFINHYSDGIGEFKFTNNKNDSDKVFVSSAFDFKGLESDMVIYIHKENVSDNLNYIAYTRAKYYLIELIMGE